MSKEEEMIQAAEGRPNEVARDRLSSAQSARSSVADYVQEDDRILKFAQEVIAELKRRKEDLAAIEFVSPLMKTGQEQGLNALHAKITRWEKIEELYGTGVDEGKDEMNELLKLQQALAGKNPLLVRNGTK